MEFHKDQKPNKGNVDPFTNLMFGENRRAFREDESSSESYRGQTERSDESKWDPWLFGSRVDHSAPQIHNPSNQFENLLNQIDIGVLMETVDEAINTFKLYQPMFNGVTPFLKKLLKKG